jgi:hypothetical protein
MQSLLFIFGFGLLLALPRLANAQLSHDEFLRLNPVEQVEYVQQLQILLSDMTASSHYFAANEGESQFESHPRDVASQFTYTPNGNMKQIDWAIDTSRKEYDHFLNLLAEKKSNRSFRDNASLEHSTRMVRLHLISAAHQAKPLPPAEKKQVLARIQVINESFERSLNSNTKFLDPDALYTADSNLKTLREKLNVPHRSSFASSPRARSAKAPVAKKKAAAPALKTSMAVSAAPSATAGTAVTTEVKTGVCIYAGFVIQKDRCVHEEKLPFSLTDLDQEKFLCESPDIICNPLIFGFNSECASGTLKECLQTAKPVCTQRVKNATQICREQSKDDKYAKRAVDLIKNNKSAFDQYLKNFKDLCDKKTLRENPKLKFTADQKARKNYKALLADVLNTCEVTNAQLDTVTAIYQASLARASRSDGNIKAVK